MGVPACCWVIGPAPRVGDAISLAAVLGGGAVLFLHREPVRVRECGACGVVVFHACEEHLVTHLVFRGSACAAVPLSRSG